MIASASILATLVLDTLVGEPPERIHPIAILGRAISVFDRSWVAPRLVGSFVALGIPLVVGGTLGLSTEIAWGIDPRLAGAFATLVLFSTTSLRSLRQAATTVIEATDGAVETARLESLALVGRNTDDLSPAALRSGAIESAAENLADGLVAPLLAFSLGALISLPVGVAAAAIIKTVNTLDSMLGYRDKPVGWASARLDDALMFLPARVSAVLIAMAAGSPSALARARASARVPTSPNSGWPMATMAAALDVRLEKRDAYVLNPTGGPPTVAAGRRAVHVTGVAGVGAFLMAGVIAWF